MHSLKKWFAFLFNKWWWVLLFYALATVLVLWFNTGHKPAYMVTAGNYLVFIAVAVLFISMVWQFLQKRILAGLLHLVCFGGSFVAMCLLVLYSMFAPDRYADDLKLPPGMVLAEPIAAHCPDTVNYTYTGTETDLLLYDDMQPGIYTYQFCTPRCRKGVIYLKAYEITRNDFLSPSMEGETLCSVETTDTMMCFRPANNFTIYEGDWDKYYGARFEVWYRPEGGGDEQKLFEKNFKVQGWMH